MSATIVEVINIGPWGLVSIFVLAVAFGLLIPVRTHNQRVKDKDDHIIYLQATIDKREEQVSKLLQSNDVIIRLLEELKSNGRVDVVPNSQHATSN